ncbi:MAG: hypothetical protein D6820_01865 [Lentisphaerae bacterium]|nr:MAG: hypothetical protein D6820_01865 [Lentisphaerota bacterium]
MKFKPFFNIFFASLAPKKSIAFIDNKLQFRKICDFFDRYAPLQEYKNQNESRDSGISLGSGFSFPDGKGSALCQRQ